MPVLDFPYLPISVEDTSTWPNSPDRTQTGAGRSRYSEEKLQNALKSTPDQPIKLSDFDHFLENYGPEEHDIQVSLYDSDYLIKNREPEKYLKNRERFDGLGSKYTVYKKDPLADLMLECIKDHGFRCYLVDDSFPPSRWWSPTSISVLKH